MRQIATFSKIEEAEMLRAFLEGSGIPASLRDAHTVSTDWALSNAVGGVKVDVSDEHVEAANLLVQQFREAPVATLPDKKAAHGIARYGKIAAALFVLILVFIAFTMGFEGDVRPEMLVASAGGIAICVAIFCALFDL